MHHSIHARSHSSKPRGRTPFALSASIAALLGAAGSSGRAATFNWDGGTAGTGTVLETTTNWNADGTPTSTTSSQDTVQWNGTVAGNLALTFSSAFGGGGGTQGVIFDIAGAQTGAVNIDNTATTAQTIRLHNITVAAGAGAFSFGNGTGSATNLALGAQATHVWTNNSSSAVALGSEVFLVSGGGIVQALTIGGSGDWVLNASLTLGNGGGSGGIEFNKTGTGTLTLTGTDGALGAGRGTSGNGTNSGLIQIQGGKIVRTAGTGLYVNEFWVGNGIGNTGTYELSGGTHNANSYLEIGRAGGTGIFNFTGGTLIKNATNVLNIGDNYLSGATTHSTGTVNMSGTATLTAAGAIRVGIGINNGDGNGGVGVLNMSGGTINSSNWVLVGTQGGTGTINLSGGAITKTGATTHVIIGTTGGNTTAEYFGTGTFNQTGGTYTNTESETWIGEGTGVIGSNGQWNMSGGTANVGLIAVGQSGAGVGTLIVSGTGTLNATSVVLGRQDTAAGTLNLNGGTLSTATVTAGTGTGTINFNGGTLKPTAAGATFLQGLTRANVRDGGAIIDTNGFNITIAQPLLHSEIEGDAATDGGITKTGAGTLALTGANTYSGPTKINQGTLQLVTGTTVGVVSVSNGATLDTVVAGAGQSLATTSLTVGTGGATTLGFVFGASSNPTVPVITTGSLTANGPVTINLRGTALTTGTIKLVDYTGTLVGGFGSFSIGTQSLPARAFASLVNNTANTSLDLSITADRPKWTGATSANWDIDDGTGTGTVNWKLAGAGTTTRYLQTAISSDAVLFDDTATGPTSVNLTTALTPASVTVSNSTKQYTFTGTGSLSGTTASLVKQGSGKLIIINTGTNEFGGGTTITAGTVQLGDGTTPGAGTLGSGNVANDGTLVFNRPDALSLPGLVSGTGQIVKQGAGTVTMTNANSSYTGVTTISGGTLVISSIANGGLSSGIGASSSAETNLILNGGTLQYTGATTTTDRLFTLGAGATAGTLDASGTGTVTFSNTGAIAFLGSGARTLTLTGNNIGTTNTVGEPLTANTIASFISDSDGVTSLVKNGSGVWAIDSFNSYSGGTKVSQGVLLLRSSDGLGTGTVNVSTGAQLQISGFGLFVSNNIVLNGVTTGLNGNNGALVVGSAPGGTSNVLGGTLTLALTSNITTSWADKIANITGNVTGPGGLQIDLFHTGNLAPVINLLNAGNDYLGGTVLNAGTLGIVGDQATTGALGAIPAIAATSLTFGANSTLKAIDFTTTLDAKRNLAINTGVTATFDPSGNILTIGGAINNGTGAGTVAVSGNGTLVLSGNNTYTGGTFIGIGQGAGVAQADSDTAFGSGAVTIGQSGNASTARLELVNGHTLSNAITLQGRTNASVGIENINGDNTLAGTVSMNVGGSFFLIQSDSGTLTLSGSAGGGIALNAAAGARNITLQGDGNGVVSGNIVNGAGTVGITKAGLGTWTLSGINTYTLGTTVSAGTLLVSGSIVGTVAVSADATLGGSGTIAGAVTLTGGTLSPDTLTTGGLALDLNSVLKFSLTPGDSTMGSGINDLVVVNGAFTLDGTLQITDPAAAYNGSYVLFDYNGTLTDNGLDLDSTFLATHPSAAIEIDNVNTQVLLTVPEPGVAATLLSGVGLLLGLRRRRVA